MAIFYARSTNSFYDDRVHIAGNIPEDRVPVTKEAYSELLNKMSKGWTLSSDQVGRPVLIEIKHDKLAFEKDVALLRIARLLRENTESIEFTTASGVKAVYQANSESQQTLSNVINGFSTAKMLPPDFYWIASDNTGVPFALPDLKGLYAAMLNQNWANFKKYQDLKAKIKSSKTVEEVRSAVWG